MPAHHKSTSPSKQHSQQRDQKSADAWLGGSTHHHHRSSNNHHPYGFIPIHVPWYALTGLGYQQHQLPGNPSLSSVPASVFFAGEQPSFRSSNTGGVAWEAVGPEQPQEASLCSEDQLGGESVTPGVDNDSDVENKPKLGSSVTSIPSNSTGRAGSLEPQTDHALRFLSRQFQEAITVCEEYIQAHETNIESVKLYLDVDSRDRLWMGLLEQKFKQDEGNRQLLRSLPFDVDSALRQALNAAQKEKKKLHLVVATATAASASSVGELQDKLERSEKRVHEIEILRVRGVRVTKLAAMALATPGKCKKLIEEMILMQQNIEATCAIRLEE